MKRNRLFVFFVFCLFLPVLNTAAGEIEDPVVVFIATEPPGSKTAVGGTGIVIDKYNGLILTARHGVYQGEISNYKNEWLFKNIKVVHRPIKMDGYLKMDGYVVHLSRNHDLAIIKVDHRFPTQARFEPSNFLAVRDKIEYEGFPKGRYRIQSGSIANTDETYLDLDMNVVEGMSGGPITVPDNGIVGIVLLEQEVGGTALRSEIILEYLAKALPRAMNVRKKTYSLCLKKIRFNEKKSAYNKENQPDLYFRPSVNGKNILETKSIKVSGSEMQWDDCTGNRFKLALLPGDRIELKVFEEAWSILKDSVFIEKIYEKLPQEGLPDLESEIVTDGNSFIFASGD